MTSDRPGDEDMLRAEARRRVRAIRALYVHASIYAVVIVMLTAINFMTGDAWQGNFWVRWPAITWGAVLLIHAVVTLGGLDVFGPEWEERKVEEMMRRSRSQGGPPPPAV
jgi:membrane protein YdbS with pleckstrin-like domain